MDVKKKVVKISVIILVILLGALAVAISLGEYIYAVHLNSAIKSKDEEAVRQIIENRPSCVNKVPALMPEWFYIIIDSPRPVYSLDEACRADNLEIVRILLDAGADVNGVEHAIPLSTVYSVKNENWYQISKLLIKYGASLDYNSPYGGALGDIVGKKSGSALPDFVPESIDEVEQAFRYVLENCDHEKVDWTRVLQESAAGDRISIVKLLIGEGYCTVEATQTEQGMTPLMYAAIGGSPEMVNLLLSYGADKSRVDEDGLTAYDYAVKSKNESVISLLRP